MTGRIYLSPPDVGPLEESYVLRAIRSGWVAPLGPEVEAFEREVAERVGAKHALALNSGTSALHLALLVLGAGPGSVVVAPTMTFAATANAAVYTGAEPVFVDCDPATGNMDVSALAEMLDMLTRAGEKVAAVLVADMFGTCADYDELLPVCEAAGAPVVEDAAQALGATYRGRPAATFGRLNALSFNGNKIITTSGGGMLLSDDEALLARCRHLATQAREPVPHYEHVDVGYNYRLSNLLAALGRAQLHRLDGMMRRRRLLRERYAKLFSGVPGVRLLGDGDEGSNCWLTSIVVDPERTGWSAAELGAHLAARDIETRHVWKPMHRQPVFAGCRAVVTGASDRLFAQGLTLPSGSALDDDRLARVVGAVEQFLDAR
ncbi:aminotransferase class I/II-fold pyridoxal phosphate-dependent enzyme [Micromonospora aurantiaca]|uniref:Aminotransferase class I/II-fold pyridoxal phosphate-dependent enzyme n=2 Tax=Micromonospora TaxID=1873 RepID=A0ABQ6UN17_9ACTN|nr:MULTISPECIES: aminotransferase class I/II-fold pyridoxal phosphate-dependent enzyme [Micromonospora]ADU07751.1 DegT/DnrJ/EryC1/StrS aminotransferase [Micromonospora sp. L5]AYF28576.1 pyridoxal-5'-phosphate-dependent protein [Micromonospora tulbaghiae]KAB1118268.1 aminotransferase class I/II-fold pyridoxal phosphate-dependent enzyme [Micromonospora aurantiaca]MDG4750547.1 aminotransferase class I/II-fold pyridoxal phosphate-dependent enzyme [Micromonospora sp. WMMD718]NED50075.1 aminotransfe